MDLQILYNNPTRAKKEKTSMRSYKHRKKNPDKRVYQKSVEMKTLNLLAEKPELAESRKKKDKEELAKELVDIEKRFAKKDMFKTGKKLFSTSTERERVEKWIERKIKQVQSALEKGVPNADKALQKLNDAKTKFDEFKTNEDKAIEEEKKAMAQIGYVEATIAKGKRAGSPIPSKLAKKLNKLNKLKEKRLKIAATKAQKALDAATSNMKNFPKLIAAVSGTKRKKKVSKKVTKKKTTKKASYKKPTRKVTKKVSRKKTKKKVTRKVAKKSSAKRSAAKKAARRVSKKAGRRSSGKRRNPIKVFSNPDFDISENPKKGRKVRKKKKKNSKRSRKAKKSLASQVADLGKAPKRKKARKVRKSKRIKIKALAGHPRKKKKHYKKKNPISIQAIKEKIMNKLFRERQAKGETHKGIQPSVLSHEWQEAAGLASGGVLIKLYDHTVKRQFVTPFLSKFTSKLGAAGPLVDGFADVLLAVAAGHVFGMLPKVGEDAKKGIIGAAVVQFGIKFAAAASTGLGMPMSPAMSGIVAVPSMSGIVAVPSMDGIIGVPSMSGMGRMSADFQGMGAQGMEVADFGAYKTVGLEGSYLQQADFDSGSVIPTAPRNPEALSGFGAYENVEYSDEGEDGDF